MVLIFVSLAAFGNYYIYDSISPLADVLAKQLHFSDSDIGLLQAIYSIPNIFMVLIGELLLINSDKNINIFIYPPMFNRCCSYGLNWNAACYGGRQAYFWIRS